MITKIFYISLGLIPIGLILRFFNLPLAGFSFALGLFSISVYYCAKILRDVFKKTFNVRFFIIQITVICMSVVLFSKYLYWGFGDYFGLLIVPIFILVSLIYLIRIKKKNLKLTLIISIYLLLTIPLFGFEFYKSPIKYIPKAWYNRYDVGGSIRIHLPFDFKTKDAEDLSIKAFALKKSNRFYEAIPVYLNALKIEPKNPRLYFDLSQCYAFANDLEQAIFSMDKAINLCDTFAPFYSNRGLLYYKLKQNQKAELDFKKAIKLDSTKSVYYYNLALTLYFQNRYEESCGALDNAEKIGLNKEESMIREIKSKCE